MNDAEGKRKSELSRGAMENGKVYEIPLEYNGTEIAIFPIGQYENRLLTLDDYYITDEGEFRELTSIGTWEVDGKRYDESQAEISSLGGYIVRYTYDTENYFYVDSEPECFSQNSEEGRVEFWESGITEENKRYSVELHPYLTVSIQLDEQGTISLNGQAAEAVKKNKIWTAKLQYGDKIVIETTGSYTIVDGDYQHIQETADPLINGVSRYTLTVTQEQAANTNRKIYTVTLDPNAKYGECIYTLDGEVVSGTIRVKEGQKLTLKYTITNNDYDFKQESSGIMGFLGGIFKEKGTIEISITAEWDGKTIRPDEQFTIVKKGE